MTPEEQFNAAVREPRHTPVHPIFADVITDDLRALVATRDAAYERWVDVEDEAQAARLAIAEADRADASALTAAVRDGKPDPGTKAGDKARRTVVVALEKVRQARETADSADRAVAARYDEERPTLVHVAIAKAREGVDQYVDQLRQAQAIMQEAEQTLAASLEGLSAIRDDVRAAIQFTPPSGIPATIWPHPRVGELEHVRNVCDQIEQMVSGQPAENADAFA